MPREASSRNMAHVRDRDCSTGMRSGERISWRSQSTARSPARLERQLPSLTTSTEHGDRDPGQVSIQRHVARQRLETQVGAEIPEAAVVAERRILRVYEAVVDVADQPFPVRVVVEDICAAGREADT